MKYSDYINSVHFKHKSISYNTLTKNSSDNKKIRVTGQQAFNLIKPYCTSRIYEQMKAVVPLALYLGCTKIVTIGCDSGDKYQSNSHIPFFDFFPFVDICREHIKNL